MNNIKLNTDVPFVLRQILYVYERTDAEDALKETFYLENQQVKEGKTLLERTPLTYQCLNDLAEFLGDKDQSRLHGFIPSRMIYQNANVGKQQLIWHRPAQKTHVKFTSANKLPKNGYIHLPNLVFHVRENDLHIYATKSSRPGPRTRVYKAPLLNLNTSSRICQGTTRGLIAKQLPLIHDLNNVLDFWEEMIFGSLFNTGEGTGDDRIAGELKLIPYLKKIIDSEEPFSEELLVSTQKRIEELVVS